MDGDFGGCSKDWRYVGDPIDVVTGANTDLTVDFRLPGPLPLRWRRHYNSARSRTPTSLGWGHAHDFERTLTLDLDGVRYTDAAGRVVPFATLLVGDESANGSLLLRRPTATMYEIIQPGLPIEEYELHTSRLTGPLRRLRRGYAEIIFRYDDRDRLVGIVDSLKRSIVVESRPDGRVRGLFLSASMGGAPRQLLSYQYDPSGNVIGLKDMYNTAATFRWDAANRLTCRTDRRGYSFHFDYDTDGRCIRSRGDDGLFEVALEYYPELRTTKVRRGDGGLWSYVYNASGTIVQITDPYGGVTVFTVDAAGRVSEEVDPTGNITRLLYDDRGHHYARVDPLGHVVPPYSVSAELRDPLAYWLPESPIEFEYGTLLHKDEIDQRDPRTVAQALPAVVRDALIGPASHSADVPWGAGAFEDAATQAHDVQGRPVGDALTGTAQYWKYDPNGNLAEHRDQDGGVRRYFYHSWNALHKQIDPLGHETTFAQNSQGIVSRVQDPGGTLTEYTYDLKDRLVEIRCDEIPRERYRYDAAANIVEKTDGQGQPLVAWESGPGTLDRARVLSSGDTHSFEFDARGRVVKTVTPGCTATFRFDREGRWCEDLRNGVGVAHRFTGSLLAETVCLGRFRASYHRDDDDDLVIVDPTGMSHRIVVSESGVLIKHLFNRTVEVCLYDESGLCRGKVLLDKRASRQWVRRFGYSRMGDLTSIEDGDRRTVFYRYDAAHRIAAEIRTNGSSAAFGFDPAGNLLAHPGLAGVQIGAQNRLLAANGDRFSYNSRDHMSSRQGPGGVSEYEYDALDMLVRCHINGEVWTASYDGLCRRTWKSWRGRTTEYYWDDFRLAAEVQYDGEVRVYVYADQAALVPFMFVDYPSLESDAASGSRYYVFCNQVGVPVRVTDDEGTTSWSAVIDAYGGAHEAPDNGVEMRLRFPGHYHDPETGLHYNRFRYYSPELGRFLQSDPAGQAGGINVYAYPVNPLIDADIDGLRGRGGGRRSGNKGKRGPGGANARCPEGGTHSSRRLVDQMIRDGQIVIKGDKKYRNAVKRDLARIASSETGRKSLETIRDAGYPVTIQNWSPGRLGNGCAGGRQPGARPPGSVPKKAADGVGTGTGAPSRVEYNPHETRPAESPPDAGLNHELGHAAHNSTGTNQRDKPAPTPATVKNADNLEEHNTTADEDNGYRDERGLPQRDDYRKMPGRP